MPGSDCDAVRTKYGSRRGVVRAAIRVYTERLWRRLALLLVGIGVLVPTIRLLDRPEKAAARTAKLGAAIGAAEQCPRARIAGPFRVHLLRPPVSDSA